MPVRSQNRRVRWVAAVLVTGVVVNSLLFGGVPAAYASWINQKVLAQSELPPILAPLCDGPDSLPLARGRAGVGVTPFPSEAPMQPEVPPPPVNEHPGVAVLHPIGIILAGLFLTLMITLFRWMFKVPPQLPYSVVKARQSVAALRRILVPTTAEASSVHAVELACRLGRGQEAEIILAYVVEVPFTLSLGTPIADEETKGQEALRQAQFVVEQHGLPTRTRIIPHRSAWGGILHLAKQEMVDAIVMSVGHGRSGQREGIGSTGQEILRRAECEVILGKMPG